METWVRVVLHYSCLLFHARQSTQSSVCADICKAGTGMTPAWRGEYERSGPWHRACPAFSNGSINGRLPLFS